MKNSKYRWNFSRGIPTLRFFGLGVFRAVTLPVVGMLYAAMTVYSAINYFSGRLEWRGTRRKN